MADSDRNTFLGGSILLLFAMLWLPLGQYEFVVEHWMKIGVFAIPFIGIGIYSDSSVSRGTGAAGYPESRLFGFLMLVVYILHQFEEHWVDLYGNHYAFFEFNNRFILNALGEPQVLTGPLTRESIFVINTALVWLVGLIAIYRSPQTLFALSAMSGIVFVNGVVHILAAIVTLKYNPGLLTSVVLFLPAYAWFLIRFGRGGHRWALIPGGLMWALLAHAIMVAGLLAANWFRLVPEFVYWLVLVIWSIVPGFVTVRDPLLTDERSSFP